MIVVRSILLIGLIVLYGWFFTQQEKRVEIRHASLDIALPANFYIIAGGYMKQLAAEMLFVKNSVFLGSVGPETPPTSYAEVLGNNFDIITWVYPRFIDPYYYAQAFLPHISPESAAKAAIIFETGITALPDELILRFFYGTNFFLSMNEPLKGAEAFREAALLAKAPPLFGRLAALLSARGGDIVAGLISLKTMLATEKDEAVRARYEEEIVIFEQALEVQKGVNAYTVKYGAAPSNLEHLVPEFIGSIPEIKDSFVLVYDAPNLHLQRPDRQK
jgi:hypothetical protein